MARAYQFICSTKINPSSNGNDRLVITASSSKKIRLHYFLSLRDEVSLSRPANRLCESERTCGAPPRESLQISMRRRLKSRSCSLRLRRRVYRRFAVQVPRPGRSSGGE
ncbi:hypothetical protein PGTUg99_028745 [Puccinia graminis f. sp. tritici]|uniref:Uncharacterized protein n=1 Tax=Puccinia graminis f. sp. tritici TaxID=56615 RepID=A0A5B0LRF8_PUCGR|nr:hypothetical protein PGTUg99_028745 [Puccinia graminis f. sp. tritici]